MTMHCRSSPQHVRLIMS